jgi:hypothetical protein
MKRGKIFLFLIIGLFLTNLSSAYYGNSLSNLLDGLDSSTIFLGAIFIIAFAFINYSLSKIFRENKAASGIVAFAVSFLIIYGINRTGFDFEGLFYNFGYRLGFSRDMLYMIVFLVIIAGIIYLILKFAKESLVIIGGLLILASFFTYEKVILIFFGIVLIISRFFIKKGTWEKKRNSNYFWPEFPWSHNLPTGRGPR